LPLDGALGALDVAFQLLRQGQFNSSRGGGQGGGAAGRYLGAGSGQVLARVLAIVKDVVVPGAQMRFGD
jgi:hypothetical protein